MAIMMIHWRGSRNQITELQQIDRHPDDMNYATNCSIGERRGLTGGAHRPGSSALTNPRSPRLVQSAFGIHNTTEQSVFGAYTPPGITRGISIGANMFRHSFFHSFMHTSITIIIFCTAITSSKRRVALESTMLFTYGYGNNIHHQSLLQIP